jgi:hypothetical protein
VVISPPVKRLEQKELLMVKLVMISTPVKRLEQKELLIVKLVVISHRIPDKDTYFTEINHVLLASRDYEYYG